MDVGAWPRNLGLGQYEAAFRDNSVDADKADVVDLSSEIEMSAPLAQPTPSAENRAFRPFIEPMLWAAQGRTQPSLSRRTLAFAKDV